MKRSLSALCSVLIIGGWWFFSLPKRDNRAIASGENQPTQKIEPVPTAAPTNGGKRLKIQFEIARAGDLKVKDGDRVEKSQLIADHRQTERANLKLELDRVSLSIEKLKLAPKVDSVPPVKVGDLKGGSVAPNFAAEKAEIGAAQTKIEDIRRKYALAKKLLNTPLPESARVKSLGVSSKDLEQKIGKQQQKIDALSTMDDIDEPVRAHEQTKLDKLKQGVPEANSKIDEARAIEETAIASRNSKLEEIRLEFSNAQRDLQVAKAKLAGAIDKQQQVQIDRQIEQSDREDRVYRTELERVKLKQQGDLQTHDRDYQLAQLQLRKSQLESQIKGLEGIIAPYAGVVRRVKLLGQQNGLLKYEVVLVYGQGTQPTTAVSPQWKEDK
jgi:hypothetical protein